MGEAEQDRPLASAPEPEPISTDDEGTAASNLKASRKKRCIKCCACVTFILLIEAVVLIILIFTVFKIKNPIIKLNGVTVNKLDLVNGGAIPTPRPGSNMSITADVSVKNPNYASFKYKNTTTSLYYHGVMVGEARGPPGKAKARRTSRMNITVDIMTDKIVASPMLASDLGTGLLTIGSFTRVGGRVKILKIVKRHVTVEMNCTVVVNITSRGIQKEECKRKVKL